MENNNFDIRNMFNEPEFKVDPQKYIERFKKLLEDMDQYIDDIKNKIKKAEGLEFFMYSGMLILSEFQRENIKQMINCLNFYSK